MTLNTLISIVLLVALIGVLAYPPYLFWQRFIVNKKPFKVKKREKKTVKSKKVVMRYWKSVSKALN